MKKLTIMFVIFTLILAVSGQAYANGATYSVTRVGENTIKLTLNASVPNGSGIEITSASKRGGKLLNIFYRIEKGVTGQNSVEIDLRTMLPPIRIILTDISNPDYLVFSDIKNDYAQEYIRHLHDMGAVDGFPDGAFKPKKLVTRAEFVSMILSSMQAKPKANLKGFKDTNKHWAKDAINTAAQMKIINGFNDGTFKPNKTITTAEAIKIIDKLFKYKVSVQAANMPKLNSKHWAYTSIKNILNAAVITDKDPLFKNFKENAPLNRSDCAMIISRAITTE
jgi:hypothetical protein